MCLWSSRTLACPPVIIPTHMFMLLASGRLVSPHLISRYPSPSLSYSAVHTLPSLCMHASFSPARSSPLCRSSRHPIYLDISFSRQASKASGGEHSRAIYDLGHQQNGKSRRRRRRARRISPFEDVCGDPESPRRRGRRRKREAGSSRQTWPLQALAMSGSFRRRHVCLSSTAVAGPPPPTPSSLTNASCPNVVERGPSP